MAWYVDLNGRQVHVPSEETAYTVDEPEDELRLVELSYLCNSSKGPSAYEMHVIDEEGGSARGKKKQAGKQRGFVVRSGTTERVRVTPSIQAAADWLVDSGVVARIDVDEISGRSKKKRRGKKPSPDAEAGDDKEAEADDDQPPPLPVLAGNECRLDISGRCHHQAHGFGFRVDVAEGHTQQRVHFFTSSQGLKPREWHAQLVKALEAGGAGRVVLARSAEDSKDGGVPPRSEAQADEEQWLQSMMGSCMVSSKPSGPPRSPPPARADGGDNGAEGEEGGGEGPKAAPAAKPKPSYPPWLRR